MNKLLSLAVITRTLLAGSNLDVKNALAGRKPVTIDIPRRHLFTPISDAERKDLIRIGAARELRPNEKAENYPVFQTEDEDDAARDAERQIAEQSSLQQQAEQANREAAARRIREAAQRQREATMQQEAAARAAQEQQRLDDERTAEGLEETEEDRQRKAAIAARFAAESGDVDPSVMSSTGPNTGTIGEVDSNDDPAHEEADVKNGEDDMNESLDAGQEETPKEEVKPKTTGKAKTGKAKTSTKKPVEADTDADDDVV